eukprot:GILK01001265.1.p1 GENE.GILK01001265.1~~GILK01001265.1.p1  ORF type:complete len:264 (+),score=34.23 GILK01001265.1:176-967(+)
MASVHPIPPVMQGPNGQVSYPPVQYGQQPGGHQSITIVNNVPAFTQSLKKESSNKSSTPKRVDDEYWQKVIAILKFAMNFFGLVMATLLSIFVPQNCGVTTCTFEENLTDLTDFNKFVLGWNFATLGVLMFYAWRSARREAWMIEFLDEDHNVAHNNLQRQLEAYPEIREGLRQRNLEVFVIAVFSLVILFVNIGVSIGLVAEYYDGFRTVTVFITNVLVVTQKFVAISLTMRKCYNGGLGLSLIRTEAVCYNVVDKDHVKVV